MKALNQAVIDVIKTTSETMNDHDQRSALGIARGWIENGKIAETNPDLRTVCAARDQLAKALVEVIRDHKPADAIAALAAARAYINAPLVDPRLIAERARQSKAGPVGSEKKNEKMGL